MDGGDFGRRIMIPESGKGQLSIDFPALPASVKLVDLVNTIQDFPFKIIDISLSGSSSSRQAVSQTKLPPKSQQSTGESRIYIQIEGYHPRLGFDSALLIHNNIITGEQKVISKKIDSNGQFSFSVPQIRPEQQTIFLPHGYIHFYTEPGDELFITAHMEELATPYRKPEDAENNYRLLRYDGDGAKTNLDLKTIRIAMSRLYPPVKMDIQSLSALEYKNQIQQMAKRQQTSLDSLLQKLHIQGKAAEIARLNLQCSAASRLMDYEYFYKQSDKNTALPTGYYEANALKFINHPESPAASEYLNLIERLEHSEIFTDCKQAVTGTDVVAAFGELNIPLTDDEKELIQYSFSMKTPQDTTGISDFHNRTRTFNKKYAALQLAAREQALRKKYDQALKQTFGIETKLLSEFLYSRRVILSIQALGKPLSNQELTAFCKPITRKQIQKQIETANLKFAQK